MITDVIGLSDAAARNATLIVGLLAVLGACWWRRPPHNQIACAAMATAYTFALLSVSTQLPLPWTFQPGPTTTLGMPVDAFLGWALLWGAAPVLIGGPGWLWAAGLYWLDLLTMPMCTGLVTLNPGWHLADAALVLAVVLPVSAFGRATSTRTTLWFRVVFQGFTASWWLVWLVPNLALAAIQQTTGLPSWQVIAQLPWWVRGGFLMIGVLLAVPGVAAVVELARVGNGTPFPWDPPTQLVSTGPFAYVANPMQTSVVGLYLLGAAATGAWPLLLAAVCGAAFSTTMADHHERSILTARWPDYQAYRQQVRLWWPRWRPYVAAPATAWFSTECAICADVGDALFALKPTAVHRKSAESSPEPLTRLRWTGPHQPPADGIEALSYVLERSNFAAAWCGWFIRLPGVRHAVTAIADAAGFGARKPVSTTR